MGRLHKAALLATLALVALPLSAAAASPEGAPAPRGFETVGATVLTAIASTTHADDALDALANGLALIEARRRIEAHAVSGKSAPVGAQTQAAPTPPLDPSEMPAASAGTNGTVIDGHSEAEREKIFANSRVSGGGESTSILLTGIALPPPDAPARVKDVINNANAIVGRPYVWGGGHGSFYSYGYDCSGSVSFALFGGGMIPEPLTSGALEGWGAPGPGKWITVYANAGHTYAEIAGLRYDTSGTESGTGPRWHLEERPSDGFVARHPPGY